MSEPAYTPKSEYQRDGSTTHYQGCKCHEARHAAAIAALQSENAEITVERDELLHLLNHINSFVIPGQTDSIDSLRNLFRDYKKLNDRSVELEMENAELKARLEKWEDQDSHEAMACHVSNETLADLKAKLGVAREALEYYADKDNWDDDKFNPTVWDDGQIDLGNRARNALAKMGGAE